MKKYVLLFLLPFFLFACSDDDNSNNPNDNTQEKNYFPLKAGNYWFYENYDLDMQNQIKTDTKRNDSVVTASSVTYLGKVAFPYVQYSWVINELPVETARYHFYYEKPKLYAETKYVLPTNAVFGLPIDKIENKWIVLADFQATNWDVFSHQFANETVQLPGLPIALKFNANYTVKATRNTATTKVSIGGVSFDAVEVVLNHSIKGNLTYTILNFPIEVNLVQRFYFVENIGLAKSMLESKTIEINLGTFGTQKLDVEGYQKNLVRYNVSKLSQ
ncbi:MAG TPA: hypothetical protein PLU67_03760 [Candidatus Kapabacteria bacterium]|nr:hypothetical protein [Candidatus Kapabacteria bacterium]HOM04593.1 hypothetical protein [Candidatus Kapabacteria bacterium]HPU22761.1 hypothetical protein [Candidatus Kapabacteria bacterium]